MRLKTKLVLAMTALTFAVVLVLSLIFMGELLRQRVAQTVDSNDVLARQTLLSVRQALVEGLRDRPPADGSPEAFQAAVNDALRTYEPLSSEMNAIIRYSPTVQDVSITDAHGAVVLSTDTSSVGHQLYRTPMSKVAAGGVLDQAHAVFGSPQILDMSLPLDRNGQAFLAVHLGVRSTFLRSSYAPWLGAAAIFSALAVAGSVFIAALLSTLALRPIETISRRLEELTLAAGDASAPLLEADNSKPDALVRASKSIDRLGEKIRTTEQVYTTLQSNLDQMLGTLREGVILFTSQQRAVMVSEAAERFLGRSRDEILGSTVEDAFDRGSALGRVVRDAFVTRMSVLEEDVVLPDGVVVQISVEFIHGNPTGDVAEQQLGALVTLRDAESVQKLEREIEISQRLAAIGRLTAGVGHEVKNPINAMVVHLELLRNKLNAAGNGDQSGAQKHVDILSTEMQRLDRVVQTLADFSRPVELKLQDHDLRKILQSVMDLTAASIEQANIQIAEDFPAISVPVRVDAELLKQALLNVLLNAAQAMADGGTIHISLVRERHDAVLRIMDTGTGIPDEILKKIFDLYFTTKSRGSGIGLSMTYRIVQLHGGSIDVVSNADQTSPEHGTTFTISLPLASMTHFNQSAEPSERELV